MILVPGKGRDVLVDLINQQNVLPSPLSPDDVLFTTPKFVQGPLPTLVRSVVVPIPDTTYEGMVPVEYERMDLTSAFGDIRPRINGLSNGNLHSMLPYIGQELGIQLDVDDFEQVDYSWLGENEEVNIPLVALTTSLSYIGQFVIRFTRRRPLLSEVVAVRDLDVMLHPGQTLDTLNKRPITLFTYSEDWSEHYAKVRKHPFYNIVNDGNAMRTLMASFGYSNWPVAWNNPMYDYSTAQVPEANKDYDRVLVQVIKDIANVQTMDYSGIAYFHYNLTS